jgi:hypothetical protein
MNNFMRRYLKMADANPFFACREEMLFYPSPARNSSHEQENNTNDFPYRL